MSRSAQMKALWSRRKRRVSSAVEVLLGIGTTKQAEHWSPILRKRGLIDDKGELTAAGKKLLADRRDAGLDKPGVEGLRDGEE